jgi:3-oxoacyl-[acyl-carrier protein] reductase
VRLKDKVIIVTGAGRNLGRAYAVRLGQEGAKLVVCDVLDCAQTAELVQAAGAEVLPLRVDVTNEVQTKEMARRALEQFGRIDGLVNNAGMMRDLGPQTILEVDMNIWDRVFAVNVKGTFLCIRAVYPYMREQRQGKIVNIGSGSMLRASRGRESNPHYPASKSAVMGLTRALAKELGQHNININTLAPGITDVALTRETVRPSPTDSGRAFNRVGVPEDLTGALVFLLSEESDWVTGQMLVVNGGMEVH